MILLLTATTSSSLLYEIINRDYPDCWTRTTVIASATGEVKWSVECWSFENFHKLWSPSICPLTKCNLAYNSFYIDSRHRLRRNVSYYGALSVMFYLIKQNFRFMKGMFIERLNKTQHEVCLLRWFVIIKCSRSASSFKAWWRGSSVPHQQQASDSGWGKILPCIDNIRFSLATTTSRPRW